ncbi:MAG: hypothetical protein DRI84_04895 [Bacteroidetes bacterium]|nr:MAG: hypothetical protein DRI84_04895 [Bacteroidota bacterium]
MIKIFKLLDMCDKKQDLTDEQKFEQKVFNSLKHFGYLFPESIKDVDRFEELHGDTEIDIPDHLQSPDILNSADEFSLEFGLSLKVAAFSDTASKRFELPEDDDLGENDKENENQDKTL